MRHLCLTGAAKYREPLSGEPNGSALPKNTALEKVLPQISITDFQKTNSVKDRANSTLLLALEELANNIPLTIKDLRELPQESTQYMLAECFAKKGALEQYCPGYTTEDFLRYIKRVWPRLQDISFGVVDLKGTVMGVATMADEMDLLDLSELASKNIHPHLTNVYGYLGSLVERAKDRLPQTQRRGSTQELGRLPMV